jgi:hypothetical protein
MTTNELQQEIDELYSVARNGASAAVWIETVENASDRAIAGLVSRIGSTGTTGAQLEARRESARAILDFRLSERSIEVQTRLEEAATKLSKVGLWATVVIGIATILVPLLANKCAG